jgi:hypothetical protein
MAMRIMLRSLIAVVFDPGTRTVRFGEAPGKDRPGRPFSCHALERAAQLKTTS